MPETRPDFSHYPLVSSRIADLFDNSLTVSWLGVSSMLIRTDEAVILIDGYFSRPPFEDFAQPLAPNHERIEQACALAGIDRLDAVVVLHSHIDHAFDSPLLAQRYGCQLIGSESTMNIARGYDVDESLFHPVSDGDRITIGDIALDLTTCEHCPGDISPGEITEPLVPPADYRAWRSGECYTLVVNHEQRSFILQASANSAEGKLSHVRADAVFLGIGQLANQDEAFVQAYWDELVIQTHTPVVFPIHWDDFMVPLQPGPQLPQPYRQENAKDAMDYVMERGKQSGVAVLVPEACSPFDPFGWSHN